MDLSRMNVSLGRLLTCVMFLGGAAFSQSQNPATNPPVNQDSLVLKDFDTRVNDYLTIHKKAQSGLPAPKPTTSSKKIVDHRQEIGPKIQAARPGAKQGDIFTPEISRVFRRLIATPLDGPDGKRIRASLRRAEPVTGIPLRVNEKYPERIPLQSTPPTLLLDLPKLPPELDYRIVGRSLVLRDVAANMIVDFLPDALPAQ
jgi:hypothetical protein